MRSSGGGVVLDSDVLVDHLRGDRVADLLIAATAERLGLPLATLDVRHYPMFEGLEPAYRR